MEPEMPSILAKRIDKFSADCRAKLLELWRKYRFDDSDLECFEMNSGSVIVLEKLVGFEQSLIEASREAAKKKEISIKRKSLGSSGLTSADVMVASLGIKPTAARSSHASPSTQATSETPSKRAREDASANSPSTSSVAPSGLQVKLKTSVGPSVDLGQLRSGPVSVEILDDKSLTTGIRAGSYAWMDETLGERAAARDQQLEALEDEVLQALRQRHSDKELIAGVIGVPSQTESILCGRVVCEGLAGRLNERSMLLEGSRASSNGARIQLNVAECQLLAAFPGQIVGVLGRSGMAGTSFHARDFLPGLPPKPDSRASGSLHAMVVSGPYTLRDRLDYSPLERVLEHAATAAVQALFLLGPFVDANNSKVAAGEPTISGEQVCSFEEVYAKHVLPLLAKRLAPLRASKIEVFIVPSLDDVLCFHPLPQPPLDVALSGSAPVPGGPVERLRNLGVQFLPNPSHLRLNGVKISITSTDALSPVLREIVLRPEGKKIEEALKLLLWQRSLFPVVPRDPAQVSELRAAALNFPNRDVPDLLIFPSASGTAGGTFVEGSLVVNPGSLCRPAAFGSFAEIILAPQGSRSGSELRERLRIDIQQLS